MSDGKDEDDREEDEDAPMFSLVTGKYRQVKRYGARSEPTEAVEGNKPPSALVLRNQNTALSAMPDSAAGEGNFTSSLPRPTGVNLFFLLIMMFLTSA